MLARAIQEADTAGFDVAGELADLAAGGRRSGQHPATELAYRLRAATQTTSDIAPTRTVDPRQGAASSPARPPAQSRPSRRDTGRPMR